METSNECGMCSAKATCFPEIVEFQGEIISLHKRVSFPHLPCLEWTLLPGAEALCGLSFWLSVTAGGAEYSWALHLAVPNSFKS